MSPLLFTNYSMQWELNICTCLLYMSGYEHYGRSLRLASQ